MRYGKQAAAFLVSLSMLNSSYSIVSVRAESSAIVISQQPTEQEVTIGGAASFTIDAMSETDAVLSYQWQYSSDNGKTWKSSTGGTAKTKNFRISVNSTTITRLVRCIVTADSGESIVSDIVGMKEKQQRSVVISQQPTEQKVTMGGAATFTIDAVSETGASLSYQWQYSTDSGKTWKSSSGATATTKNFKLAVNATTINRVVRCIVTADSGESIVSDIVGMKEKQQRSVVISQQPTEQEVTMGGAASFTIDAMSETDAVLSYQWQYSSDNGKTWKSSTGGTAKTKNFRISVNSTTITRLVRCIVTADSGESIVSDIVGMKEKQQRSVVISQQPTEQKVTMGGAATFTIDAVSETGASLSYQWQYSTDSGKTWKSSSGATATTKNFKLAVNATTIKRVVRCIVTASSGESIISETAGMVEISPITLTALTSQTITIDSDASFTIEATGTGDLTYLWESSTDGENWTTCGENSNTLTVDGKTAVSGTQYRCTVSDNYGQKVTTNTATLTIKKPLEISSQPVSITATENNRVTFSIEATGENVSYQWQKATSDTEELLWTDIEGATYGTYTFTAALADNGNRYRCMVSDGEDTINSSVATLTVKPDNAVITNGTKEITINKGEAYQLDLVGKGLRYIANASNVTVDKYGVVNAKETGTGYVFVIDFYGHKCFYKIHVVEKYEELAFDEIEYNVMPGESVRLYTNKNASYVISDTDRASVYTDWYEYNYCNVTCYIPGSYTVIAYNEYGELAFTTVNVEGNVTDIEVGTNYEGETDTNNSVWYKYVNDSDVEELITFDIEDSSNAAYVYYNQGSYSEPNYYWEDEIARNQMYVQPGDEVYVRMISDSDNAANYDFTVNIVPCASVDYTIGEELEDVVLDRDDYTEYSFTPDSSGEFELTAFSRNEFNWIITDSENNVVKNEYSNGAVYKTFNLKENENYTIRFTPNSMTETGSLTFEITKATDDIIVADVNTVYDTGIIRSGQTVYYKFEICKNSDNPAFDVFAFSREYSDYLSYTVLGSDMFTPYELNWDEGIAKLYFEEATDIYVKIENKSDSADTPNFEIKQYEKTVTQLSEEAENTAEIGAYEADWYEFTAPENGRYNINFYPNNDVESVVYLNYEVYIGEDMVYNSDLSNYYDYYGINFDYSLFEGEKIYIKVTGNHNADNEIVVMTYNWSITSNQTYLLEELTLDTLAEGKTVEGKKTMFKFTAPKTGTYYFWSESKYSVNGALYSDLGAYCIAEDYDSGYANNFCITYRLTAGETVYLQTEQVSGREIGYNIMVSKTNNSQKYRPLFEFVEMKLNTPIEGSYYNSEDFDRFKFTAETAGTYVFTSESSADMYGELYSDINLSEWIDENDDSAGNLQFRIEISLEERQTVYLKPRSCSSDSSSEYSVIVTKIGETEILGTVDSYGDISTSSSFNTDSSSAIIQVNCMNSISMDFYMLTNSEINMWTALSLESDDNRENEQTGIEFSFNYAPMADCYYIFIETTDGSSIGDIEVGYTYNELEPGYEDVCAECGGLNSEHTPDCSMGFVEDGSED